MVAYFGSRLRAARLRAGLSQEALAVEAGVSYQSLVRWERKGNIPGGHSIKQLADALAVSTDYLLAGDPLPDRAIDAEGKLRVQPDTGQRRRRRDTPPGAAQ